MNRKLTPAKAKEILKDGKTYGYPLTKKQQAYMGLVASGKRPHRAAKK